MPALFNTIVNVIAPILLIVALGAAYGRAFNPDPRILSNMILYLFSPFLALEGMANANLNGELGRLMVLAVCVALIMAIISIGLARTLRLERRVESAFILSMVALNAGNYGIAFNEFAYGSAARPYAVMYYVMSSVIANTLGVYFASRGTVSTRTALFNVFTIPLMYGTIIGLAFNLTGIKLPLALERTVNLLADGTIPAMLIVLGLQLGRAVIRGRLRLILLASGVRLIAGPMIGFLLVMLFHLTGLAAQVAITTSAMPTAVIAGVLATQFGGDSDFVNGVVICSTLGSIVTLSVIVTLVS